MTHSPPPPISRWRYGMHPDATEMQIRSLSRVYVHLGEALRMEMTNAAADEEGVAHLQYYIATELGPWALWLTAPAAEVADCETALRELTSPFAPEPHS
jgi:hypothetical protein